MEIYNPTSGSAISVPFSNLTSGTNTIAAMVVGQGASFTNNGPSLAQGVIAENSTATYTIDKSRGTQFDITLNSATPVLTLAPVTASESQTLPVTLIQDGTGGRLPSWSNVTWAAGVAPTVASGITLRTYLMFISDGVTWTGYAVSQSTGTGPVVLQTSPTINTPAITTPTISGTTTTSGDIQGSSLLITANQLNQTSSNSDSGELAINYHGFNNGTSVFRVCNIYDGKQNPLLTLTGLDKSAVFAGSVRGFSPVNTQTGTTFAPALVDNGTCVTLSNASAITVTIPANASVAFPIGASIDFASLGAGIVTFAITTDTLVSKGSKVTLTGQYSVGNIKKIATTTWLLSGDLA